jgi:hypothetical protein
MDTLTRKSSDIARHLTPRAVIICCPSCGRTVTIGLTTKTGTRVFCEVCGMGEVRREG